jgi:hypothetical protein
MERWLTHAEVQIIGSSPWVTIKGIQSLKGIKFESRPFGKEEVFKQRVTESQIHSARIRFKNDR